MGVAIGSFAIAPMPAHPDTKTALKTGKADLILKDPLQNYLSHPDRFLAFVGKITPSSVVTVNVENKSANCPGGKAAVTITALRESWKVAHKKDFRDAAQTAPNGYVLAQIDVANCDFLRLQIPTGHRAYWVVNLDQNLMFQSHFIDVGPSASPSVAIDRTPTGWTYVECPQSHKFNDDESAVQTRSNVCYAHDDNINILATSQGTQLPRKTLRSRNLAATVHLVTDIPEPQKDQLIWIVCADGCCYADER